MNAKEKTVQKKEQNESTWAALSFSHSCLHTSSGALSTFLSHTGTAASCPSGEASPPTSLSEESLLSKPAPAALAL